MQSARIEYGILKRVRDSDGRGFSINLPQLVTLCCEAPSDNIPYQDVVDALKRLHPQYLTLRKWRDDQEFIEYRSQVDNDDEFFYRNGFQLMRTLNTAPHLEELTAVLHEEAEAGSQPSPATAASGATFIADTRLNELRNLNSTSFDFRKLIRLCEEINTVYKEECYFATAMLTRGLLDHVPPLFGKKTFSEVANQYSGGSKAFKDTMQHLESAARKIADGHLHTAIRKSETLPVAQQVNFAPQLDVLLSEIIRISR